ncbi:AAA family ATPase [Streptomyces sp. SID13726]|uniref:nSTAND1 domain-containing NTPase n=1 Tax=Streptomyces sp. SID13726 TaxID=2706058 RepID=UPI0013B72EBA|nr:AAA family ATPase [Streptomyces sp. SID13726]NEA99890.1 AAA family ATPase [Streptomyces sp. SID13726]
MIVTFYSYKGGVGRSMALANIADQLARSGMRVLMVDFDLEAPGLEHFFPIDHARVRGREGLLDLLLAFKYAMSVASSAADEGEEDAYRDLDRYITTVYPRRSDGGRLDLLTAGLRQTDDQISRYGAELRRFDWQDFYYVWSGELFFEWFRRTCAERYDIVLVDSRTGVTELGGVCAYQLADTIVALCAPNLQNLDGTAWMVRHFLSPQVRAVRGDRPLEVLVVPARVDQQDPELLDDFAGRFRRTFDPFAPDVLERAGLTFWELQVPYVPAYAFDEQVITDPGRAVERRALVRAYDSLRNAIALLAPERNAVAALRPAPADEERDTGSRGPVETLYDPTTRFTSPDVFLSYGNTGREAAGQIRELLAGQGGLRVAEAAPGERWERSVRAKISLVLVGSPSGVSPDELGELGAVAARGETRLLPVVLPGTGLVPLELRNYTYLDFSRGLDANRLLETVRAGLNRSKTEGRPPLRQELAPYRGLMPFSEADAPLFFGRDGLMNKVLDTLERFGTCTVVGEAGSGKTSLVNAGVLPLLRRNGLPGSDVWPVVRVDRYDSAQELQEALRSVTGLSGSTHKVVVVLDQFERLLARDAADREGQLALLRGLVGKETILPLTLLRADFLAEAHEHAAFLVQPERSVNVWPMSTGELRQAVEMPARAVGLQLEPGLVDLLLKDVGDEPSAASTLQFVLHNMWTYRREGYLTHEAYMDSGGVRGTLVQAAEEWFRSLSTDDYSRAREFLLHLGTVGSDGQLYRRAVSTATIAAMGATDLSEQLLQRRLLVTTYEARHPCVRLAHHALVDAWPTFRQWIEAAGSALQLRQRLAAAAEDWESSGHPVEALLGERSLAVVESSIMGWMLGEVEKGYLAASQADIRRKRRTGHLISTVLFVFGAGISILYSVFNTGGDGARWWSSSAIVLGAIVAVLLQSAILHRNERRSLTP